MRLVLLWIGKNYRYRAGNCLLPLLAFFMSALLLSVSVLYVSLDLQSFYEPIPLPFDFRTAGRNETAADILRTDFTADGNASLLAETPYVDLYPYVWETLAETDPYPPHRTLCLSFVEENSALAPFWKEQGCDVSALGENEIYIAPYIRYYFADRIEGDTLTLPAFTDENGAPLRLTVRGMIPSETAETMDAALLSSSETLQRTLTEQSGKHPSMLFFTLRNGTEFDLSMRSERVKELHADIIIPAKNTGGMFGSTFASGDLAIVLCAMLFSFCGMACTVRLKSDREESDRRKLYSLGLAPVYRVLLPVCDLLPLGAAAFAAAFPLSSLLFRLAAPGSPENYRSNVMLSTYVYHPKQLLTAGILFFSLFAAVLVTELVRTIPQNRRKRNTFVKQSARLYYGGRHFVPRYLLLRASRKKGAFLYLAALFCFPLIVCAVYGTAGNGITDNGRVLYADTDIFIGRDYLSAGTAVSERSVQEISALPGVFAVFSVHHTGVPLSASTDAFSADVIPTELNGYILSQTERYCTEGDLPSVLASPDTAAVVDNAGVFHAGDRIDLNGKKLTVGAVLSAVPMEEEYMPLYVSYETLRTLSGAKILPSDTHICLSDTITAEERASVREALPLLLYDPHAFLMFRQDEIAVQDHNGLVSQRTVTVMNVLIVLTSILSVFLFAAQSLLARRGEFSVLYRLGYSRGQLIGLVLSEYAGTALPAFAVFAGVYGFYIAKVNAAIAEMQVYQYAGFSFAVREIVLTACGLAAAAVSAVLLTVREKRSF